ncbi:MAG TPA: DUF1841 family protein [Thermodesulfobacteriota bacterium]|nr:DUF1841 family protein [Thermodesulfobacteriota bacterium]
MPSNADSANLNIIDSVFEAFRQANRKNLHAIWRKAQDGQLDGLAEEERRLAELMLAHSGEYFNQFEFADVLADHKFDPEGEVNPFMHVALHALLEKQLKDHEPIEALQFYNAMLRNRCTAHEAIHLLMGILLRFLFSIFKRRGPFDLDGYRKLLKIYKTRKPDRIAAFLESEPASSDAEVADDKRFQVFAEMRAAMKGQAFKSIEEAQAFADAWLKKANTAPKADFLGLSSEQMHRMMYRPFEETSDIVTLSKDLPTEKILGIPIVKETVYFIRRLGEMQPLKATVKGNLPRAFAREIHDQFPEDPELPWPIMSEEDDAKLSSLRYILEMCGWIKKRNQKFYLTKKGTILNGKEFAPDDFHHLFRTYTRKFYWASRDPYPELEIIQQAFLFSCYILHIKAKTCARANELSTPFIQAFPAVLKKEEKYLPSEDPDHFLHRCFYLRFIERFCEYFGLVTIEGKEKRSLQLNYLIRTTPFFDEMFRWK